MLLRITISADSPKALPITGTNVVVAAFIPFEANPSTPLVICPSRDKIDTKIVITIPNNQTIPDLNNLASLSICIFDDKFEIIPNVVVVNEIGSITYVILFAINTTEKIINGCIKVTEAIFPTC